MWGYVRRNALALFRIFSYYSPLRFFWLLALILLLAALLSWLPFLIDSFDGGGNTDHMQSVILGAVFAISAVQMFAIGIIADQIASLRAIAVKNLREAREIHYGVHENRRAITKD